MVEIVPRVDQALSPLASLTQVVGERCSGSNVGLRSPVLLVRPPLRTLFPVSPFSSFDDVAIQDRVVALIVRKCPEHSLTEHCDIAQCPTVRPADGLPRLLSCGIGLDRLFVAEKLAVYLSRRLD